MTPSSRLEISRADSFMALALGAGGGAVAGIALPLLWPSIRDIHWLSGRDVLHVLMSTDGIAMTVIRAVLLAAIGLAIMTWWVLHQPRLTVSDSEIEIRYREGSRIIRRDQVSGIRLHGQQVVIESVDGRTLFDDDIEGAQHHADSVFIAHGYPWRAN